MIPVKHNEQLWRLRKTELQKDKTENICDIYINKWFDKEIWLSIEINGKEITLDEYEVDELLKQFNIIKNERNK